MTEAYRVALAGLGTVGGGVGLYVIALGIVYDCSGDGTLGCILNGSGDGNGLDSVHRVHGFEGNTVDLRAECVCADGFGGSELGTSYLYDVHEFHRLDVVTLDGWSRIGILHERGRILGQGVLYVAVVVHEH